MNKAEAIRLLGGTVSTAAQAIRVSSAAISQWPDEGELPPRITDRVQAALWRMEREKAARSQPRETAKPVALSLPEPSYESPSWMNGRRDGTDRREHPEDKTGRRATVRRSCDR